MKEISNLEYIDKGRVKLYLDGIYFGALYQKEFRYFELCKGKSIEDSTVSEIEEILYRRGKERALYILQRMDKTEKQMIDKLCQNNYSDIIVLKIIDFLKNYQFIDDYRYMMNYVRYKEESRSVRKLKEDLYIKGIPSVMIKDFFDEYESKETAAIDKLIVKRIKGAQLSELDTKSMEKLYRYLLGKGFKYDDIKQSVNRKKENDANYG